MLFLPNNETVACRVISVGFGARITNLHFTEARWSTMLTIAGGLSAIPKLAPNGLGIRKPTSGPKATYH
jgi:hypothetical protein